MKSGIPDAVAIARANEMHIVANKVRYGWGSFSKRDMNWSMKNIMQIISEEKYRKRSGSGAPWASLHPAKDMAGMEATNRKKHRQAILSFICHAENGLYSPSP